MANNPFYRLSEAKDFKVTSEDITDGLFSISQYSGIFGVKGGNDISPHLKWSGAPADTKSYTVTMFDVDAPTGSGFWHWAVVNIPASINELATGAGDEYSSGIPEEAFQLPNDARIAKYIGAAPPTGHGEHRYYIVVHALNVEDIGVAKDGTPALLGFNINNHILGRAVIIVKAEM